MRFPWSSVSIWEQPTRELPDPNAETTANVLQLCRRHEVGARRDYGQ